MISSELIGLIAAIAASGLVSGYLAGLFGVGGGAVLVPVFYAVFGFIGVDDSVRMHVAVAASTGIILPTAVRSFLSHKARGAVDLELLGSWLLAIPAGVVVATVLAGHLSGAGLRVIFAVLAFLMALKMLFLRGGWALGSRLPGQPWCSVIGTVIGFLSTLMGIGGGVFSNTFMTLYGRPIHQAVATSSGVGVLIAVPGTLGYMAAGWGHPDLPPGSLGFVNLIAVASVIPITLIAAPLGVRTAHSLSRATLEKAFGVFLMAVSANFIWTLLGSG